MPRTVLLNPGPVNITDKVRQAMALPDLCHREKEFSELAASIRAKLLQAFQIEEEFASVLVSGSGTAALEMAVSSCLTPGRSMLVIENGVYGERISKLCDIYKFRRHTVSLDWGVPPNPDDIENILKKQSDIEVVSLVHHETTTGLLNPLRAVGELAKKHGKIFLADCVSSMAGDEIDFSPVDLAVGAANKCLQGAPGVSFVLLRKKDLARLAKIPARTLYFNLTEHHKAQETGGPLFTPAVPAHYALNAALDELIEETTAARIKRHANAAKFLREGFQKLNLEFLIPEQWRSNCLTGLKLPNGMTYEKLHGELKSNGFVIYAGQGNLSNRIFRVANMGDIKPEEFKRFLKVCGEVL